MAPNCAAIHYNILDQNCGNCPSTTQHNRVDCHNMEVGRNLTCTFKVQNIRTCDNVAGNTSIPVNVTLKGNQLACTITQSHGVVLHLSYSTICSYCCGYSTLLLLNNEICGSHDTVQPISKLDLNDKITTLWDSSHNIILHTCMDYVKLYTTR